MPRRRKPVDGDAMWPDIDTLIAQGYLGLTTTPDGIKGVYLTERGALACVVLYNLMTPEGRATMPTTELPAPGGKGPRRARRRLRVQTDRQPEAE